MKTKIYTLIMGVVLFTSCQQEAEFVEINQEDPYIHLSPRMAKSRSVPNNWNQFKSHAEMVEALQLSEEELHNLSTTDLVHECMTYPLAFDCFAFNDISHGLDMVMNNFNGFLELQSRTDALQELINYYDDFLMVTEYMENHSSDKINPLEYAFIELVLSSHVFGDISQYSQFEDFVNRSDGLISRIEALSGYLCETSHNLLLQSLGRTQKSRSYINESNITIYTKNGLAVSALKRTCINNSAEHNAGLEFINGNYPNVTIVKDALCEYNCHAYAWYVIEGGQNCWINCGPSLTTPTNVSKFWEDGTYEECTKSEAKKVFYKYNTSEKKGDHSAVVINDNLYESKWGAYQLVRHAPDYCPYGTSRVYFKYKSKTDPGFSGTTIYGDVWWDHTPDPTPIGTIEFFSINNTWNPEFFRTEAFVCNDKDPDSPLEDSSRYTIVSFTDDNVQIRFNKQGVYYVSFHVYHKASGKLQASYISDQIYVQ